MVFAVGGTVLSTSHALLPEYPSRGAGDSVVRKTKSEETIKETIKETSAARREQPGRESEPKRTRAKNAGAVAETDSSVERRGKPGDERPESRLETLRSLLLERVRRYNPRADFDLIERAIDFGQLHHRTQRRASGEEYFIHPLETAIICAEMNLDTETIVAALLHDVVEDTLASLDEVQEQFGEQVAFLVDGVTKLEKITFSSSSGDEEHAENFRKMFVAMANDVRVILIKLADRLHNMRTIEHLPVDKQIAKARETLDIYAPLAHRLGMAAIKAELEDRAFAVLEPKKYQTIKRLVAETKVAREAYLATAIETLTRELGRVGIQAEITGRVKHFYSIHEKMQRKGSEFNEIYDLLAVRVITKSLKDCYGALGVVHSIWKPVPGRFKDYIAVPKFNLYQSLHTTIIGPEGKPLEIQIRTEEMHRVAEYGVAAHWRYKEGITEPDRFEERIGWLRQILEFDDEYSNPREFMKALRMDLLGDEVFVFTPKGDVYNLPAGSTPIDFAYAVHTEVGHRCVGAKVNGKIVPLDYRLQIGDQVQILTSNQSTGPSRDWLNIVRTSRARNKIRAWFSKEAREDSIARGKEELVKFLRKAGIFGRITLDSPEMKEVASDFNARTLDDLFAGIGNGHISPKQVTTRLIKRLSESADFERDEDLLALRTARQPQKAEEPVETKGVVQVKGVDDVLVRFARCCNPVPGDDIVGYITRGRGVSVHRRDCPNMKQLGQDPNCLVEVGWSRKPSGTFKVGIQVEAIDRTQLLRDITAVLSDAGVNILNANLKTTKDGLAIFSFVFEIGNVSILDEILANLKKIDNVFDAYRV